MTDRRGVALVPLLLLLAGMLVCAGAIVSLAVAARAGVSVERERVQARLSAEAGLRGLGVGAAELAVLPGTAVGHGVGTLPGGATWTRDLQRLGAELFLFRAEGRALPSPARRLLGRILWRPAPAARLSRFAAVLTAGGPVVPIPPARIDGDSLAVPPPGWPLAACAAAAPAVAAAFPTGTLPPVGMAFRGPGVGPLDVGDLIARAVPVTGPAVAPTPVATGGACLPGPGNWGSPGDPLGPCGGHFPLLGAKASLRVTGGEGQGILVVDGDLTLEGGTRFAGILLVAGTLTVRGGARVEGFAEAGAGGQVGGGAVLLGSACAAWRALEGLAAAIPGTPLPDGGWIEPF